MKLLRSYIVKLSEKASTFIIIIISFLVSHIFVINYYCLYERIDKFLISRSFLTKEQLISIETRL